MNEKAKLSKYLPDTNELKKAGDLERKISILTCSSPASFKYYSQ